jgi:hypothetical protein
MPRSNPGNVQGTAALTSNDIRVMVMAMPFAFLLYAMFAEEHPMPT